MAVLFKRLWMVDDGSARSPGWLDGFLEGVVYTVIAVSLLSRSYPPELADKPLTLALALVAALPPLLLWERPNAQLLSRLATAVAVGLLVQTRLPISIEPLRWQTPRGEALALSLTGVLMTALALGVSVRWLRGPRPPQGQSKLAQSVVLGGVGLAAMGGLLWVALNRVQEALSGVGLYLEEWAGAVSIVLQMTALCLYALSIDSRGRAIRLACVAAVALAVRNQLPPSGGL